MARLVSRPVASERLEGGRWLHPGMNAGACGNLLTRRKRLQQVSSPFAKLRTGGALNDIVSKRVT